MLPGAESMIGKLCMGCKGPAQVYYMRDLWCKQCLEDGMNGDNQNIQIRRALNEEKK